MSSVRDRKHIGVLHRANIEIFWIRDTDTVKGILGYPREIIRREREGGRLVTFTEINDWPDGDKVVMGVDIQIM